jgi:hypothetical protein
MGKDPLEDHIQAYWSEVVHCTCLRQSEGVVGGRRKVRAQAHQTEVVACEEWIHVEGSTEQGEAHMLA